MFLKDDYIMILGLWLCKIFSVGLHRVLAVCVLPVISHESVIAIDL